MSNRHFSIQVIHPKLVIGSKAKVVIASTLNRKCLLFTLCLSTHRFREKAKLLFYYLIKASYFLSISSTFPYYIITLLNIFVSWNLLQVNVKIERFLFYIAANPWVVKVASLFVYFCMMLIQFLYDVETVFEFLYDVDTFDPFQIVLPRRTEYK